MTSLPASSHPAEGSGATAGPGPGPVADDIEESLNEAVDILLEGMLPPGKIPEKRSDNDEGRERR